MIADLPPSGVHSSDLRTFLQEQGLLPADNTHAQNTLKNAIQHKRIPAFRTRSGDFMVRLEDVPKAVRYYSSPRKAGRPVGIKDTRPRRRRKTARVEAS